MEGRSAGIMANDFVHVYRHIVQGFNVPYACLKRTVRLRRLVFRRVLEPNLLGHDLELGRDQASLPASGQVPTHRQPGTVCTFRCVTSTRV